MKDDGLLSGPKPLRLDASAKHEWMKLEAVEDAAAALSRAVEVERNARDQRDRAIRAAVKAGLRASVVAQAAGISPGRVSHLMVAPRP